jgi:ABC-type sugar transport system ATPase subunit
VGPRRAEVLLGEELHDPQAQAQAAVAARALGPGLAKRLEDVRQELRVDAFAAILHPEHDLIARALASDPDVLLMDEPTAGVDTANQQVLSAVLARLAARGTTMVIVTHELAALSDIVTRIVVVQGGHLVFDGLRQVPGSACCTAAAKTARDRIAEQPDQFL